jgi:hypothetical protein
MRINYMHVLIALALGALLLHLYRTKTNKGKQSGS